MKIARSLIPDGRKRQLQLPAAWCARSGITAGHPVNLLVHTDSQPDRLCLTARRGGRGLRLTVPAWWCRHHGVAPGDSVLLLEREPGLLELQTIEGASEKALHRRSEVVMQMRIAKVQAELQFARDNAFREGYWRRALGDMFSPGRPPITCPPRGSRG
ncbi:MAG: AbrB/MazE/SpoVT family DNA-binding domain-containing protein [Candidatus Methylomirabilota bacterium]|jgi:bifunctional DNA-binding transcriptional regulator/antitoxin component of YhaV-PrlF toxin-antitoxin module